MAWPLLQKSEAAKEGRRTMVIWQGRGGTTALFIVVSIILVTLLNDWTGHRVPDWMTYFAMAIPAAAANALFVVPYARTDRRTVIDKETGQEAELRGSHTLFWIPVKYWTFIILAYPVIGTLSDFRT
jgi:hypothetical protein